MGSVNVDTRKLLEVNDVVYKINSKKATGPVKIIITEVKRCGWGHFAYKYNQGTDSFFNRSIGKTYFKTEKEAKEELLRLQKINKKRTLLKEYEQKLNQELNLEDHIIIK